WNAPRDVPSYWDVSTGENVLWSVPLGTQTYPSPVSHGGKVFIGTNNAANYVKRYAGQDLGVLLCFDAASGKFLWQHSNPKLAEGRVYDWPMQGVCTEPVAEGDRLWYISNRAELCCLDTEGFRDGKNDGDTSEPYATLRDADVVWKRDLIADFGVSPHNMSCGECILLDRYLFFVAPNGVDESHVNLPAPNAPAFLCLDKQTGKLIWQDNSPSPFLLHGQWGTPIAARLGGVQQVIFPGGDGWLYSFQARPDQQGKPQLLWKFDCNSKASVWRFGGKATRCNLIQQPTVHQGKVLAALGQDPEHGEGPGRLVCIDPTRRGDVSAELVVGADGAPAPRRRTGIVQPGEKVVANPNSALIWDYTGLVNQTAVPWKFGNNRVRRSRAKPEPEADAAAGGTMVVVPHGGDVMHRTISRVVAKGDLLIASDAAGFVHCLDVRSGRVHWVHDMWAAIWGSPVIAGSKVYLGTEDGIVGIFELSADRDAALPHGAPIAELEMPAPIYSSPVVDRDALLISTRDRLYAIRAGKP
ncbi:MAG: PQQ-binding-like beta-propeller repeat protein, partial [Planctomycetales bacterium]|nr:PQQ-binding-like beta-propeller repeat protein [Planctomycetales bacterium]